MWPLKYLSGWTNPAGLRTDLASLARALGHRDSHPQCLVHRQGRCPGLEHCPDCTWKEGVSRS